MKYFIVFFFFTLTINAYSQQKQTLVKKAHNKKIKLEDFSLTVEEQFKVKVFTVDKKAMVNKTHHWFLQILTTEDKFANYANVEVKGHLKKDPTIDFYFMNPVMKMCSEGKYIIGFVKVKHAGTYVLNIEIDNFGVQDKVTVEIEMPDALEQNEEVSK